MPDSKLPLDKGHKPRMIIEPGIRVHRVRTRLSGCNLAKLELYFQVGGEQAVVRY